ncbi:DUF3489 domain-containing protein [Sphingopyxis sp. P8]|uniref:DUF3489 domain-containing protein n=1 Tax=Sphingopyxis sp. P8 TaxID=2763256 RepID=UPI001D0BC7BD|nr:DUF3489 domain-containing protein [Sphingopyxis sp. P8]
MTSTVTMADTSAFANHRGKAARTAEASKERLRASSEAHRKRDKKLVATASPEKTSKPYPSVPASEAAGGSATQKPRQTKASLVEALLAREGGANLAALSDATGWRAHTCRAFLTGLRKKGREVIRASDKDGKSIYLIAPDRSPAPSPATDQTEAEGN